MSKISVTTDKKNLKQAITTKKKVLPVLRRAEYLLTPIDPYYKVQSALKTIMRAPLKSSAVSMEHIFEMNTIVTLNKAIALLSADYQRHPSKKREYELIDLKTLFRHGHGGFYSCFYVQDNSPMSVYNRLQCVSASRNNVLHIINTIYELCNAQIKMYKHAIELYVSPKTMKKCKRVFGKERIKTPKKVVIPF